MSLFLDFDGTGTTEDTINALVKACVANRRREGAPDQSSIWDNIVNCYSADYTRYKETYLPTESRRRTVADEVAFLRGLRVVEERSLARVNASGLFRGFADPALLHQAGQAAVAKGAVKIRPGLGQFIAAAQSGGWDVTVLSVNWSSAFIRGVMTDQLDHHGCGRVAVVSNDITDGGTIVGPRLLGRADSQLSISTSEDKVEVMQLLERHARDGKPGKAPQSLYIGDSNTDLECLLAASRGVVMANNNESKLRRTLERLDYPVPHVAETDSDQFRLAWARNFEEVLASGFLELEARTSGTEG